MVRKNRDFSLSTARPYNIYKEVFSETKLFLRKYMMFLGGFCVETSSDGAKCGGNGAEMV